MDQPLTLVLGLQKIVGIGYHPSTSLCHHLRIWPMLHICRSAWGIPPRCFYSCVRVRVHLPAGCAGVEASVCASVPAGMQDCWWEAKGKEGFTIYQYQLTRCEGQGPLLSKQVAFARSASSLPAGKRVALRTKTAQVLCTDYSRGAEQLPVRSPLSCHGGPVCVCVWV